MTDKQLDQLGANIRRHRLMNGLTQELLAERCNLNARTIQKIESGNSNIRVKTLVQIRGALGCSWATLLDTPDNR